MIRLRKIEPEDVPFLYQWENDAEAWADGANHNPLSHCDLRDYVHATTGDIYRDGQLRLIVEEEGITMGCVDLFDVDIRNRRAAIGVYIAPAFRGQGVGQKAICLLEDYAFAFLHLRVLYAVIRMTNKACCAIFDKLDYHSSSPLPQWTLEGDAVIYTKVYETGI